MIFLSLVLYLIGIYLIYFFIKYTYRSRRIRKEYELIKSNNFNIAMKKYPSAHLLNLEDEWYKQVDRQLRYANTLNKHDMKKFKMKYSINDAYLENLDCISLHEALKKVN